ncbi:hypothetical protein CFOL_v3_07661 [Cephalotus follicularis]|uniref:Uncharacterized protein n=1 Tax=Cephalotus follicularis TaxID=3775 RepID=A0A1Q3B8P3_CEPFO|nr:hypothetical protein CFOL_v3_07661 [Cephalotus follicularis]
MEGMKLGVGVGGGGGGGGRVGVGEEDMGDGMQCSDHPYRNNPGGICAFCLQEKLGKLVSSSFPLPIRGSSSSSPSPSFRSDMGVGVVSASNGGVGGSSSSSSLSLSLSSVRPRNGNGNGNINSDHYQQYYTRRARIPFLLAKKKKKIMVASSSSSSDRATTDMVFKRSKSTTAPMRTHNFLDDGGDDFSPRKRGFWSFLYHSSKSNATKKLDKITSLASPITTAPQTGSIVKQKDKCLGSSVSKKGTIVVLENDDDDDSPNSQANGSGSSLERKVSRSRSVGCGSRSFSGDFFERISTGFGDCTLRRVESQREGKPKAAATTSSSSSVMKERVKCGGIFGGFIMTSSSSSSSSSSYWVSSSAEEVNGNGKSSSVSMGSLAHGRNKSWGWAFASPMRAFSKPSKDGRRVIIRESSNNNNTPNLDAIPSLLAVRG